MNRFVTLLFLSLLFVSQAQDRASNSVEIQLQRLLQDPAFKHGEVGFIATNLDNGRIIAEYNPYRALVPASIQKLYTTAAAIHYLGADFQFKTKLSYTGEVKEGVLYGNLIIKGGGDPTLQSRFYKSIDQVETIRAALNKAGIKSVQGKLIIDVSQYTKHTTPDSWIWEDMGNYFGATPTALMWKDNMLEVDLRSGQAGSDVMLATPWPADSPYQLDLAIKASEINKDNAWFFSAPSSRTIYGKGTIPAHKDRFTVKISNPDPVSDFASTLVKTLKLGAPEIVINYSQIQYEGVQPLLEISSSPLAEIIKLTNTESVNLFAEALNIALDQQEIGKSVEGGLAATMKFLADKKVNSSGLRLLDGSGVSPNNRITAQSMIDLLGYEYRSSGYATFRASLSIGGQTGTMKHYFTKGAATGNIVGKSGTMRGVRNYAGYVKNKYDETIAYCLIMNDYDESRRVEVMQKVEALIEAVIAD